jgi:hypothetical protein
VVAGGGAGVAGADRRGAGGDAGAAGGAPTTDSAATEAAGVPAETAFRTKPRLARAMLARALDGGVMAGRVTGDEVSGSDRRLRVWLEARVVAERKRLDGLIAAHRQLVDERREATVGVG